MVSSFSVFFPPLLYFLLVFLPPFLFYHFSPSISSFSTTIELEYQRLENSCYGTYKQNSHDYFY